MCACSVSLGVGGQQAGRAQAQQGIVLKRQRLLAAARLTAFNLSTPDILFLLSVINMHLLPLPCPAQAARGARPEVGD
jgi:hypothetical protein